MPGAGPVPTILPDGSKAVAGARIVAHVDMDAFYAAVEERYHPELRGQPLVVGADPKGGAGRGVVTTANYLARRYGIRSAMPISRAWRLAEAARRRGEPATLFIRGHHDLYARVSALIMAFLAERAAEYARTLKREIAEREGLTCSVGIGPNKLVAKIASDAEKPDGLTVVPPEAVQAFLDPRPVRVIPGVGPKTELFLRESGIRTVRDLRAVPLLQLVERIRTLAGEVAGRLQAQGFRAFRTVTLTVRFENFTTVTRAWTAPEARSGEEAVFQAALRLLLPFLDHRENPRRRRLRLIGIRLEKLLR